MRGRMVVFDRSAAHGIDVFRPCDGPVRETIAPLTAHEAGRLERDLTERLDRMRDLAAIASRLRLPSRRLVSSRAIDPRRIP